MDEPEKYLRSILEALLRDPQKLLSEQLDELQEKAQVLRNGAIESIKDIIEVLNEDMDQLARWDKLQLTIGLLGQLLGGVLYIHEACEAAVTMGRH